MANPSSDAGGQELQLPVPEPDHGGAIAKIRRVGCWDPRECLEWSNEPGIPRVVDGIPKQLDQYLRRNSALGNAVVPVQAKYAFSVLSGLLPYKGPSMKTVNATKKRLARPKEPRKRKAPEVVAEVAKKPYLGTDAPGARRSGRIRAMRDSLEPLLDRPWVSKT